MPPPEQLTLPLAPVHAPVLQVPARWKLNTLRKHDVVSVVQSVDVLVVPQPEPALQVAVYSISVSRTQRGKGAVHVVLLGVPVGLQAVPLAQLAV